MLKDQWPATGPRVLFRHKQVLIALATSTGLLGGVCAPASAQGLFGWGNFWGPQPGYSRPHRAHPARPAVTVRENPAPTVRANPAPKEPEKPVAKETPAPPARTGNGVITITVSLNKQKLAVYSDGVAVLRSQVTTGRATPTGVFSIIQKDRWHHSDTGDSPFMQRITWSGIGMHQGATSGAAAPGSIRLPEPLARQLWGMTKVGTRVIITNGEVTPATIASGRLFARRREPAEPAPELRSPAKIVESAHNAFVTTGRKREPARPASKPGDPALEAYAREPATSSEVVRSTYDSFDLRRARRTRSAPPGGAVAEIRPLQPGPISVFISRREGKLFVRKGFEPIYNSPVSFAQPERPLGTHVFTALDVNDDDSLRWDVVTVPTGWSRSPVRGAVGELPSIGKPSTAAEALDRVAIPPEAVARISELMSPGASLIISDEGLGPETGTGTDFTVITR